MSYAEVNYVLGWKLMFRSDECYMKYHDIGKGG
jgi:hypothetical protein